MDCAPVINSAPHHKDMRVWRHDTIWYRQQQMGVSGQFYALGYITDLALHLHTYLKYFKIFVVY
jgi:hypothetical protein